jgi:hypothetical protein
MSVYMHVTLLLKQGKLPLFRDAMKIAQPIAEAEGWKLHDAFLFRSGRLNTVIDIWELRDMNHYERGIAALQSSPRFEDLQSKLADSVESETVCFCDRLRYV